MKIISFTPINPYPLNQGGAISQFAVMDKLRHHHQITLVLFPRSQVEVENIIELQHQWPEVKIRFIRPQIPQLNNGGLDQKIYSLIRKGISAIKNKGKSTEQNTKSQYDELQNPYITNINHKRSKQDIQEISTFLDKDGYDLVQIDFIELSDIVYLFPENQKKILVHHELRSRRIESLINNAASTTLVYAEYILRQVRDEEKNILAKFDGVVTFSEVDKELVLRLAERANVLVSPFPVLSKNILSDKVQLDPKSINRLTFVGGDAHYPNLHAVEWFGEHILPQLFQRFRMKLHVIGEWSENNIARFGHLKEMIVFTGFVDDLGTALKNSIMVCPVMIGSGIRTKILYAMAQNIPVISTTMGCEGIKVINGESILIANNTNEFEKAVSELINNSGKLNSIVKAAMDLIVNQYTQDQIATSRNNFFKSLFEECR